MLALIGIGVVLAFVAILYSSQPAGYAPFQNREPLFMGYRGNVSHTEPIDLGQLQIKAWMTGYTVQHGNDKGRLEDEYIEGPTPINGTYIWFVYTYDSDYTYFSFNFEENDTQAMEWLWDMVIDSLNLEGGRLAQVKNDTYANYQVDAGGAHLGCYVEDVEPNWEKAMAHMGTLLSRDNHWNVGRILFTYKCGAVALRNDPAMSVSRVVYGAKVGVMIDGDSDFYCYIDTDQKIVDPEALFTQVFHDLGLPESLLEELSFEEVYAAYA
jgi:hypothetical protein